MRTFREIVNEKPDYEIWKADRIKITGDTNEERVLQNFNKKSNKKFMRQLLKESRGY